LREFDYVEIELKILTWSGYSSFCLVEIPTESLIIEKLFLLSHSISENFENSLFQQSLGKSKSADIDFYLSEILQTSLIADVHVFENNDLILIAVFINKFDLLPG